LGQPPRTVDTGPSPRDTLSPALGVEKVAISRRFVATVGVTGTRIAFRRGRMQEHRNTAVRIAVALLVALAVAAPLTRVGAHPTPAEVGLKGLASWYADFHHGRPTASGELFDQEAMTAAHRSLPFGTIVRVTNLRNGKTVDVRVNDRGPFVTGRVIDLSRAAARAIGSIRRGIVPVRLQIVAAASPELAATPVGRRN
jgi:rare lipoprotein A